MITWWITILIVLALPALGLAGWRMGTRRRPGGLSAAAPKPLRRADLAVGEVRPRVRKASYDRLQRRR